MYTYMLKLICIVLEQKVSTMITKSCVHVLLLTVDMAEITVPVIPRELAM